MSWARIDDGFDDHPKVLALLEHDDGAAAIGLWTLCLAWAHRNTRRKGKTPGRLPASLPRRYLGVLGRDAAKLLVDVGMWELAEEGWQIHDFDKYLPTAETSEARSEAGKKGAASRWGNRREPAGHDGKLPSSNGKPLASGMATDGTAMAGNGNGTAAEAPEPGSDQSGSAPSSGDGNLPFPDSNEPSVDGNAIASDGSRAGAHRAIPNGIAPGPTPVPEVPPTAGAKTARRRLPPAEATERQRHVGEVVAAFVEGATGSGLRPPPASLKSRVGKQARELLAEDWPIDFLIDSARRLGGSEYDDLAKQVRIDDASAAGVGASRASPGGRRQQETDGMFDRAMQRAREREERHSDTR